MNRSRKVTCPECSGANFWKSNPAPAEELYCHYCHGFVSTYEDFILDTAHREAEAVLAQFTKASTADDLAYLKTVLTNPVQQPVA